MGVDKTTIELALEALPEGIVLLDEKKRIQFFNHNALAVFPLLKTSRFIGDVYHQFCQDCCEYIDSALEGTASNLERYAVDTAEGRAVLYLSFYPLTDGGQVSSNCLLVFRDLTEQLDLNAELEARFEEISQQLKRARKYQEALFTSEFSDEYISCKAYGQPALELSGDFFSISVVKDRHLLILGDVQSHGIDVAMKAVMLQQLCRRSIGTIPVAGQIMKGLNEFVCNDQQDEFWTCCMFIGSYDPLGKTLYYSRSGVPEPILVRANGEVDVLTKGDMPLGFFVEEEYHNGLTLIEPGDRLLVCSDGLTETGRNGAVESFFGHEKLVQVYQEACKSAPGHHWEKLLKIVQDFHGSHNFEDDITMAEVIFH